MICVTLFGFTVGEFVDKYMWGMFCELNVRIE